MNRVISFILIILGFSCTPKSELPVTIPIDNWQFKKTTDSLWLAASVPGNVHSDLLDHELIEHPFIGDNETRLQWISESNWEYKTNFNVDKNTLQKKKIRLEFEGLDTYASVFLNDSLILKTNNAFLGYKVNVKSVLKSSNELRILFENTAKYEDIEQSKLSYNLPEGPRIFTRKAQFQYGWDWGPKLNTSGIWRPIKLTAWNDVKIDDILIIDGFIDSTQAQIIAGPMAQFSKKEKVSLDVFINDSLYKKWDSFDGTPVSIDIKNPKLWWPHNLGEPFLYDIKFIIKDGRKLLDSVSVKKGFRTIELVTEKDSIGESFYFKVNNVPVYAKGANYIPQNSIQNKVTDKHYETLLDDVVEANMNMLRVWGGG
ncbi:MAG: glycoside hydrolase family 2 protein, partial [Bacteroidia bacterium]|nr:glycoside hydrolase family 2 protein [Bacteroidia bacterium]